MSARLAAAMMASMEGASYRQYVHRRSALRNENSQRTPSSALMPSISVTSSLVEIELLGEGPLDDVERHGVDPNRGLLLVDKGVPVRVGRGLGAVGTPGLGQDAADVACRGVLADEQARSDLAIGEPAGDETEDLRFPRRQLVGEGRGNGRSQGCDPSVQRLQPDLPSQPFCLAQQRSRSPRVSITAGKQQARVLVGGVGEPRDVPICRFCAIACSKCCSARSHSPRVAASIPK